MNKQMKRFLSMVLAISLLIALSGCGAGGNGDSGDGNGNGEKFVVGYVNSADTDVFDKLKKDEFEKITKDDPTLDVRFSEANMDVQKQLDLIDNLIAQQVDLIIIVPVDYSGVTPGVQAANNAGIPVICLGIESEGGDYTFVGCQNRDAGVMQAEFMAEKLPENAQILYLSGTPGLYHSIERHDGFLETLGDKRPDVKLLAEQTGEYQRAKGQQVVEDWVQSFSEFDAVVAANDQMALGAIEALKGANRLEGVMVAGVDATADACTAITNGEMAISIKQSAPDLAKYCYETVQKAQKGETLEKEIIVPFIPITIDNVATDGVK